MADDRTYYVICADNCKFEGMTKEQIFAAIAEATGATPTDVDSAFISKIKEINKGATVQIWQGTNAEYNAVIANSEKRSDVIYIITDDTALTDLQNSFAQEIERVENEVYNKAADTAAQGDYNNLIMIQQVNTKVENIAVSIVEAGKTDDGWCYRKYSDGTADMWGTQDAFCMGLSVEGHNGGEVQIKLPEMLKSVEHINFAPQEGYYIQGRCKYMSAFNEISMEIWNPLGTKIEGTAKMYVEIKGTWK